MRDNSWSHAICELCWAKLCRARGQPGRIPVRVLRSPTEPCCFCGYPTMAGIFVGRDPGLRDQVGPALKCNGTEGRHSVVDEASPRPRLVLEAQDQPPARAKQLAFTWSSPAPGR